MILQGSKLSPCAGSFLDDASSSAPVYIVASLLLLTVPVTTSYLLQLSWPLLLLPPKAIATEISKGWKTVTLSGFPSTCESSGRLRL